MPKAHAPSEGVEPAQHNIVWQVHGNKDELQPADKKRYGSDDVSAMP